MEKQNPLENIRNAILASQLFGVENDISQLGVSDELMTISDALDSYYGIVREKKDDSSNEDGLIGVMNEVYRNPGRYSSILRHTAYDTYYTIRERKIHQCSIFIETSKGSFVKNKTDFIKGEPFIFEYIYHHCVYSD